MRLHRKDLLVHKLLLLKKTLKILHVVVVEELDVTKISTILKSTENKRKIIRHNGLGVETQKRHVSDVSLC